MGDFGLAAGEVLFAEVLVTPTGVSKGCGYVFFSLGFLQCWIECPDQDCRVCFSRGCSAGYS